MWEKEERPCPVCGDSRIKRVGVRGGTAHRSNLGVEANVVRCRNCTAFYTFPALIPVSNPYENSQDYFINHSYDEKIKDGEQLAALAEQFTPRGKVLEIGCGRGELLQGFQNRGWDCTGVEMTDAFAAIAESNGVRVIRKAVEETEFAGEYDAVLMPAVLEHLYNPTEVLKRVAKALKPSGIMHIEVPNEASLTLSAGNLYYKLRGINWSVSLSPSFPPYHVCGFTPKALNYILDEAGLKAERFKVTQYQTNLPPTFNKAERIIMKSLTRIGYFIGRGDGLNVWARRSS